MKKLKVIQKEKSLVLLVDGNPMFIELEIPCSSLAKDLAKFHDMDLFSAVLGNLKDIVGTLSEFNDKEKAEIVYLFAEKLSENM